MRMERWASGTPDHFLIHVRGAIHAIMEMELDTKFQEAMKAVESASLEVDLTKMQYKDELERGRRMIPPSKKWEPASPLQIKPRSPKRQRVMSPLQPRSLQLRQHLT